MKSILILVLVVYSLYADMPQKIWTIASVNNIESTEDDFVPPPVDANTQYISSAEETSLNNPFVSPSSTPVDDLPLAKTYPADDVISPVPVEPTQVLEDATVLSQDDLQQRVKEIQSVIQKSVSNSTNKLSQSQQNAKAEVENTISKVSDNVPVKHLSIDKPVHEENYYLKYLKSHPIMLAILVISIISLFGLLYLLFRSPKEKQEFMQYTKPQIDDTAALVLARYTKIKGQMHKAFLQRKENIFFHDEFTPYQRAKATLELEKEYNDLEHVYLPKLFSSDVHTFIEGVETISVRPELKEMLQVFASQMIEAGRFTKNERKFLEQKITAFYHTATQVPQNAQAAVPDKETAYFLQ